MSKRVAAALVVLGLLAPLSAQRLDPDINARIREEANAHSQIMRTLHFLTDRGGRQGLRDLDCGDGLPARDERRHASAIQEGRHAPGSASLIDSR
jgi:hypothetical protein